MQVFHEVSSNIFVGLSIKVTIIMSRLANFPGNVSGISNHRLETLRKRVVLFDITVYKECCCCCCRRGGSTGSSTGAHIRWTLSSFSGSSAWTRLHRTVTPLFVCSFPSFVRFLYVVCFSPHCMKCCSVSSTEWPRLLFAKALRSYRSVF